MSIYFPNVNAIPQLKRCLNLRMIARRLGKTKSNPAKTLPKIDLLGSSVKVAHSSREGWENAVMYLSPADIAGGKNMCVMAGECKKDCLSTSGNLGFSSNQLTHIFKTLGYQADQNLFLNLLIADIARFLNEIPKKEKGYKAKPKSSESHLPASASLRPTVRLNGTSDELWESVPVVILPETVETLKKIRGNYYKKFISKRAFKPGAKFTNIFEVFPNLQFYDYTKWRIKNRENIYRKTTGKSKWPSNYHLTFSLDEKPQSAKWAHEALEAGHPVAAVFNTLVRRVEKWRQMSLTKSGRAKIKKLIAEGKGPKPWEIIPEQFTIPGVGTYKVTNADITDLRFKDVPKGEKGRIAWLSAKGDGIRSCSGFVRDIFTGLTITTDGPWKTVGYKEGCRTKRRRESSEPSTVQFQTWEEALVTGRKYQTKKGKMSTQPPLIQWPKVSVFTSREGCMFIGTIDQITRNVVRHSPRLRGQADPFDIAAILEEGARKQKPSLAIKIRGDEIYVQKAGAKSACPPPEGWRKQQLVPYQTQKNPFHHPVYTLRSTSHSRAQESTMARKNPFRKGKLVKVPKGKRKGQVFTHKGLKYIIISRVTPSGKRVRYAQRVSANTRIGPMSKRRKATKKKAAKGRKRRNPYAGGRCKDPRGKNRFRAGYIFSDDGRTCVVQRTRNHDVYYALAHTKTGAKKKKKKASKKRKKASKKTSSCPASGGTVKIPKGKKKGDYFKKGNRRYVVVSYTTKGGKRVRFARRVKAK